MILYPLICIDLEIELSVDDLLNENHIPHSIGQESHPIVSIGKKSHLALSILKEHNSSPSASWLYRQPNCFNWRNLSLHRDSSYQSSNSFGHWRRGIKRIILDHC